MTLFDKLVMVILAAGISGVVVTWSFPHIVLDPFAVVPLTVVAWKLMTIYAWVLCGCVILIGGDKEKP